MTSTAHQTSGRPSILLVPPEPFGSRVWDSVAGVLEERGYTTRLVEAPGRGMSVEEPWSDLASYADRLAAIIEEVPGPLIGVGWSVGFSVLLRAADALGAHEVRFSHIVGVDQPPARRLESSGLAAMLLNTRAADNRGLDRYFGPEYPDMLTQMRSDLIRDMEKVDLLVRLRTIVNSCLCPDWEMLSKNQIPLRVLWGEYGSVSADMVSMMGQLSRAPLQSNYFTGAGHFMPVTHPQSVVDAVLTPVR